MSLIEQAAKRLEQLRQAGVELPEESVKSIATPLAHQAPPTFAISDNESSERKQTSIDTLSPKNPEATLNLDAISCIRFACTECSPAANLLDEFRVIKRPLIANGNGTQRYAISNGNLIMVTSALPGEGKSLLLSTLQSALQWSSTIP